MQNANYKSKNLIKQFRRLLSNEVKAQTEKNKAQGHRTAAVVVIGDEILKGQVLDTNTQFLCKGLWNLGVKVGRVAVLPDNVDLIASQIPKFSKEFTYVLTAGGIGPTHDDVTYEAIARAFNEPIVQNSEILEIIKNLYKEPSKIEAGKKMAMVPESAKLTYGIDRKSGLKTRFPNISVQNVYIFPGIPELTRYLFSMVAAQQFGADGGKKFYYREIFLNVPEVDIVVGLNYVVEKNPEVNFGSYPEYQHSYYNVKLTMESTEEKYVEHANNELRKQFQSHIVSYDPDPLDNSQAKLYEFVSNNPQYKNLIVALTESLAKAESVGVLFDGYGRSTLLVHLCYTLSPKQFDLIWVESNDDMRIQFIAKTLERYSSKLRKKTKLRSIKEFSMIALDSATLIGAITDEALDSEIYNPLIDFPETDIWHLIRGLSLNYCKLDDKIVTNYKL